MRRNVSVDIWLQTSRRNLQSTSLSPCTDMGAAGSALSLAIDVITPSTRANPEESVFVTAMMTSGPLVLAALRCLSTKGLGRLQAASPTLRGHDAIVKHMQASRIATFRLFQRVIFDDAVNARLWFMLRPRDMDRMTVTGAYGLYLPKPPGRDWERREEDNQAFSRHIARLIMKDIRENREFAERKSANL